MSEPKRIRLSRKKGWRIPEGAVIVDRRSKWGNWYKPVQVRDLYVLQKYRDALPEPKAWLVITLDKYGHRTGSQWGGFADKADATRFAVEMHARSLRATRLDLDGLHHHEYYLGDLRGHDLACGCPLDAPCHADVLLELANAAPADKLDSLRPSPVSPEDGAALIAAERLRQVSEEGWTPEHDDEHDDSELVMAAEAYLWASRFPADADHVPMPTFWPWDVSCWNPDPTRNLVRAGALIAAEIDRRQRASGGVS